MVSTEQREEMDEALIEGLCTWYAIELSKALFRRTKMARLDGHGDKIKAVVLQCRADHEKLFGVEYTYSVYTRAEERIASELDSAACLAGIDVLGQLHGNV